MNLFDCLEPCKSEEVDLLVNPKHVKNGLFCGVYKNIISDAEYLNICEYFQSFVLNKPIKTIRIRNTLFPETICRRIKIFDQFEFDRKQYKLQSYSDAAHLIRFGENQSSV